MIKMSENLKGTKMPVSELQEYMVKKGGLIPQYELVHSGCGSTKVWFKYKLSISNVTVFGEGPSKKDAKHNTAKAMLVKLGLKQASVVVAPPTVHEIRTPEVASPKVNSNAIGSLNEFCARAGLPLPQYVVVSEDGPPHKKEFSVKCVVSNESEISTAFSKQEAKHQSAAKLLKKLSAMTLSGIEALEEGSEITPRLSKEELKEIIEKFKASSSLMKQKKLPTNTFELPFKDYHHVVKMDEKINSTILNTLADIVRRKDLECLEAQLEINYDYFLRKLLQELNLKHEFILIPPHKKSGVTVVALNINYTISLSFLGVAQTHSMAVKNASVDALRWFAHLYV